MTSKKNIPPRKIFISHDITHIYPAWCHVEEFLCRVSALSTQKITCTPQEIAKE